jgi:hypothetical protein
MSKMVPVVKPITPATVATTTAEKEFGKQWFAKKNDE